MKYTHNNSNQFNITQNKDKDTTLLLSLLHAPHAEYLKVHTHTVKRINMINHIVMRADVKGPSTGRSVYIYTEKPKYMYYMYTET